jgi:hypothetical protein
MINCVGVYQRDILHEKADDLRLKQGHEVLKLGVVLPAANVIISPHTVRVQYRQVLARVRRGNGSRSLWAVEEGSVIQQFGRSRLQLPQLLPGTSSALLANEPYLVEIKGVVRTSEHVGGFERM